MTTRGPASRQPSATPIGGTLLSLATHAALLAAVVAGDGAGGARGHAPAPARPAAALGGGGGERLLWVGIDPGPAARAGRSPGARPPVAYVIPGRGAPRPGAPGARAPGGGSGSGPGSGSGAPAPVASLPAAPAAATGRRPHWRARLPDVQVPDPEATLLVAGVLSVAPDLARLASRAEDFERLPGEMSGGVLVTAGAPALELRRPAFAVDDLPIPLVDNPPPAYPSGLARARVGGRVVVEFTIDSAGAVDLHSLRVVQSTDARFTLAVERVLPRLRFRPAQLGERPVGVTVRQPFVFTVRRGR